MVVVAVAQWARGNTWPYTPWAWLRHMAVALHMMALQQDVEHLVALEKWWCTSHGVQCSQTGTHGDVEGGVDSEIISRKLQEILKKIL